VAKVNGHSIGKKVFEEAVQRTLVRYQSQGQPCLPASSSASARACCAA